VAYAPRFLLAEESLLAWGSSNQSNNNQIATMKELTQDEMSSLKGGLFDTNAAVAALSGNTAVANNISANVTSIAATFQDAYAEAEQEVDITQIGGSLSL
jgi:hypothetical protein